MQLSDWARAAWYGLLQPAGVALIEQKMIVLTCDYLLPWPLSILQFIGLITATLRLTNDMAGSAFNRTGAVILMTFDALDMKCIRPFQDLGILDFVAIMAIQARLW